MKKIKFYTDDQQVMKDFPPKPITMDMPKWLENVKDSNQFNITNCAPAMDMMSSGYVLYNAWETILTEKVLNFKKGIELNTQNQRPTLRKINPSVYSGECMPIEKGPFSYFRLETDFKVVTPPGYSCLVMQPYYDFNSKFTVLPGIIDTDRYDWVITAMAYTKEKELRILPGEKIVQIIPFKRDEWQMETKHTLMYSQLFHYIRGAYNKLFRAKKVFK